MNGRMRGQALVETAVAVGMFAMILCALPCLVAYQDIQRTALRGARDTVFLAGWYRARVPDAGLVRHVRHDLAELPWRHPADGARLLTGEASARARVSNDPPAGEAAGLLEFIAAPLLASGSYLGPAFALEQKGLRTAAVEVNVPAIAGAPAPFSELELSLQERAVLLTDSWNAAGPGHVAERAAGLVPGSLLRAAQGPVRVFTSLLGLLEPDFRELCPGLIEAERVPASRLRGRASAVEVGDPECH